MSDRTMTVTEASRNFADLVNRSFYRGETTILMKSGEAVAEVGPIGGQGVTGRDWIDRWKLRPHLDRKDAEAFEGELEEVRAEIPDLTSPWD